MTQKEPTVWVLCDDRVGHVNQALGVVEALDVPFIPKKVVFNRWGRLPNMLRGRSLLGVSAEKSTELEPPWPDVVIAAGRRVAPVSAYIKKQNAGRTFCVQLMWPGFPEQDFDFIAVPEHDGVPEGLRVMQTLGAPHRITPTLLEREAMIWQKTLELLPKPYIALLVGGDSGKYAFTPEHAAELGKMASGFAQRLGGSLLVTTSRRTTPEAEAALKDSVSGQYYYHNWQTDHSNPYIAFLALSEAVLVTGDSVSMCSESCAAGKAVFIYAPEEATPAKHQRLHQALYDKGYAAPFTAEHLAAFSHGKQERPKRLDTAAAIAAQIKKRLGWGA